MDNASVHSAATTELRDKLAYTEVRFFPKKFNIEDPTTGRWNNSGS